MTEIDQVAKGKEAAAAEEEKQKENGGATICKPDAVTRDVDKLFFANRAQRQADLTVKTSKAELDNEQAKDKRNQTAAADHAALTADIDKAVAAYAEAYNKSWKRRYEWVQADLQAKLADAWAAVSGDPVAANINCVVKGADDALSKKRAATRAATLATQAAEVPLAPAKLVTYLQADLDLAKQYQKNVDGELSTAEKLPKPAAGATAKKAMDDYAKLLKAAFMLARRISELNPSTKPRSLPLPASPTAPAMELATESAVSAVPWPTFEPLLTPDQLGANLTQARDNMSMLRAAINDETDASSDAKLAQTTARAEEDFTQADWDALLQYVLSKVSDTSKGNGAAAKTTGAATSRDQAKTAPVLAGDTRNKPWAETATAKDTSEPLTKRKAGMTEPSDPAEPQAAATIAQEVKPGSGVAAEESAVPKPSGA